MRYDFSYGMTSGPNVLSADDDLRFRHLIRKIEQKKSEQSACWPNGFNG